MNHFAEAKQNALSYVRTDLAFRNSITGVCLIWDLQGRLRLLLRPQAGQDPVALRRSVSAALGPNAMPFWSGEVWVWNDDTPPTERLVYEKAWRDDVSRQLEAGPPEIRLLERHVSKDAWFVPGVQSPWPLNAHTPPILSFFSFKGGVGRTTALISLGIQLARSGSTVVLVDLDLESPGLHSAVPPASGAFPPAGVLDYLLERPLVASANELRFDDYFYTVDAVDVVSTGVPIRVIPAGRIDEVYLEKLARLNYEKIFALSTGQGDRSPLVDLLKHARSQLGAQYLLLDSRAGFHDIGGLALSGLSHLDVLFGLDSEQSWQGLETVVRFLGKDRLERGQHQLDCALILGMAPEPGPNREQSYRRYNERAHNVFSDNYYNPSGSGGEWPLPGLEDDDQPHYPLLLPFDPLVHRYQSAADVADRLTQGEFRTFAELILGRIGRNLP